MRGRRVEPIWSRGKSIRKSSDRTGRVISKIGVAVVDEQHRYFEWLDFMERVIARPIPLISRAHSADRRDSATGRKSGREKKNSCILSSKSRAPRVDRRVDSWGRKQRANPIRNQVQQRPGDEIRNQPGRGTVEGGGEEEIPFVPTRHGGTAALRRQQSRAAGSWLEDRRRSPARGRRPVSAAPAIVTIAAANGPRRPGRGVIAELAQRATAAHFRRRQTAASPSDDVAGKSCSPLAKVPALLGLPDRTHASMIHAGCLPPPETFWCSVFDRFSIFSIKPELKTGPREELTQVLVSALNFVQLDTLCGQFNSCYKATNFQWPFWKAIFWAF